MSNKMIIDASHPEETRVVVSRVAHELRSSISNPRAREPLRGNIYLAKVTRVEPSLQAAFIDYGGNRHGFLAFSEIHPDCYQIPIVADRQALSRKRRARTARTRKRPPANDVAAATDVPAHELEMRGGNGEAVSAPAPMDSDLAEELRSADLDEPEAPVEHQAQIEPEARVDGEEPPGEELETASHASSEFWGAHRDARLGRVRPTTQRRPNLRMKTNRPRARKTSRRSSPTGSSPPMRRKTSPR